ncbi:MAG: hypothetical protein GTO45_29480 [Candidatus Aminicenantes bacterium]|nr:hypothetical protein [Candidatus Aminicenantes bacterium]NIM82926.1 hypothetical protein [Candidatus Aminicenantes bacterium]NIN22302.1 hypothetical protein [Candidatus Aminicenantes bacterium]NIN46070.1 hypothetical protein [Candidatus Aminicenantes bacterium]NIN88906.1 hypothetical protein [Candidatus Aminicenantes bacterium]
MEKIKTNTGSKPGKVPDKLELKKVEEVKVKYANNHIENKEIYRVVTLELMGRKGNFDILVESEGSQPLIGQIVLERLDLIVEPSKRRVIPNPRSPEMTMVAIFLATADVPRN